MEGRIVHGSDADIEQFPHSAYLAISCAQKNLSETYGCGASVISQMFLLSAAHCLDECDPVRSIIAVAVGSTTRSKATNKGVRYQCHPKYHQNDVDNDICIIKLKKPVTFSARVKKALIMKTAPQTKIAAVVSGWGIVDVSQQFRP
ncbi:trypsin-like [Pectinophora gossypiella]|uniref:trypsin-like n=1 Tax=Pectinophora gossypiella TaxID=13191 RepID=UPI00214F612D|nr:trypsin-like [Pectinophora gossypiella]